MTTASDDGDMTDEQYATRVRRASLAKRLFIVAALVYGAAIPAILLVIVDGIEEQQDGNVSVLTDTRSAAVSASRAATAAEKGTEQIESCTTPGGECYERGQETTGAAVADINRVIVLASACADRPGNQTRAEIQRCVLRGLVRP